MDNSPCKQKGLCNINNSNIINSTHTRIVSLGKQKLYIVCVYYEAICAAVYAVLITPIMLCINIVVSEVCYYIAKTDKNNFLVYWCKK